MIDTARHNLGADTQFLGKFDSQNFPGTNWGGYASPTVDKLVTQALAAPSTAEASALWHQADQAVMADAPFVPFQTQLTALFRSARVHKGIDRAST